MTKPSSTTNTTPTIIIIVGLSGDLGRRKLLPALGRLAAAGVLPEQFQIVGITRRPDVHFADLLDQVNSPQQSTYLQDHGELFQMSLEDPAAYQQLAERLSSIEHSFGQPAQRLFYLSVPPQFSSPIIANLGSSGLAQAPHTKLLVEKPFGVDLASATNLVEHIQNHFQAEQVYRIDHYLAKEMAQNLIIFRQGNPLFHRTWNKDFISRIDIIATETIGIENRATFYEQTGALRDLIQSHLLQLAALTLMSLDQATTDIPARRLAALRQLHAPAGQAVAQYAHRGQYQGYRAEVNNPNTTTETFASLSLESSDPAWAGVPVTVTTGKALGAKTTEIRLTYRAEAPYEPNQLILRLQPNEGVELHIWTQTPAYDRHVEQHSLRFNYQDHFDQLPEAYERVFLDAINSDHRLFATSAEVLETWRILEPVQAAWGLSDTDLTLYQPGSSLKDLDIR